MAWLLAFPVNDKVSMLQCSDASEHFFSALGASTLNKLYFDHKDDRRREAVMNMFPLCQCLKTWWLRTFRSAFACLQETFAGRRFKSFTFLLFSQYFLLRKEIAAEYHSAHSMRCFVLRATYTWWTTPTSASDSNIDLWRKGYTWHKRREAYFASGSRLEQPSVPQVFVPPLWTTRHYLIWRTAPLCICIAN